MGDGVDVSTAWINGRTLAAALKATGATRRFGKFSPTDRVPIDPVRDSYVLGIEREHGFPFVVDENLLVTIHDFDLEAPCIRFNASDSILALANLRFSRRALASGISGFIEDTAENETRRIEHVAAGLNLEDTDETFKFSSDVCKWGRGGRVWGNLKKFHSSGDLGAAVSSWLQVARDTDEPAQAIAPGAAIKGLGVSFASKHLRLFDPARFATLDEVISVGLGYALNGAGYNLWLHDLHQIKKRHELSLRIADIESGIFVLVRQIVRGAVAEPAV